MKISVFGLGYVGCVSAACFAKDGHQVIGVDINPGKVEMVSTGRSPIIEPGVEEMIAAAVKAKRLRAIRDTTEAIHESDISLVCVGTPSRPNGSLDLKYVQRVCEQIGAALTSKDTYHLVVIRSTLLPGTIESVLLPLLETHSGKCMGRDFGIVSHPEFLREGSSIADFYDPPFTVIGANDQDAAGCVSNLYANLTAPVFIMRIKEAEMVKYVCNSFHALKVSFANEIGNICKALAIDSHNVMDVFCQDTKLNLSPYYLKPGFAFGGSCLPKDLRALNHLAKQSDIEVPVLASILPSNSLQIERATQMILATGRKRLGVLGLSFKAGTDDLRESPMVTLIEKLIGKGMQVSIYDRNVSLARIFGANKEYIEHEIPHISKLMRQTIDDVIRESDVIVVANKADEFLQIEEKLRDEHVVIDLVRLFDAGFSRGSYNGICW